MLYNLYFVLTINRKLKDRRSFLHAWAQDKFLKELDCHPGFITL